MRWLILLSLIGCGENISSPPDAGANPDMHLPGDGPSTMPTPTVLRVHYPAGDHQIALRGSLAPLTWDGGVAMTPGPNDTWTWSTTALTDVLEWKPLLDDQTWSRGPNYRVNPGDTVDVFPHFLTAQGKVVELFTAFHSTKLPDDRPVWAYLPPSYDENTLARFPVIYMHDGQNLFDAQLAFGGIEWGVDETLDAGAENGLIVETIAIGIGNTQARIYEYTPTDGGMGGGGGNLYLSLITDELKPKIDSMLRTRPQPDATAIMGSSLGGLISAYAGVRRPQVFGRIGAMSPSTWWDNTVIITDVAATAGQPRPMRVYVDSGDTNDDVSDTDLLAQTYVKTGFTEGADFHHVVQAGGQHNEFYWAQRLPAAFQFLLGPRDQ